MELKQIPIDKILANFSQPREQFDRAKTKELAESILSNGLINPISVRVYKNGKFMIVSGERRWQAHKIAGLNNIQAFVKEYKNDIDWQIESLVENWQREDLTSTERENNVYALWKTGKFATIRNLSKRLGAGEFTITNIIRVKEIRDKEAIPGNVPTRTIRDAGGLESKDRKKLLKQVEKGKVSSEKVVDYARAIKKAPEEVKEALLDDKINVEQAERISKLKTEPQREKAIQEHKSLAMVGRGVERNIENQMSVKEQREFDKRLIQSGSWLESFRGSVTDSRSQLQKTIKILLFATRFIPVMDEKQKERLEYDLDRFIETLDKAKQLSEQIQDNIERR